MTNGLPEQGFENTAEAAADLCRHCGLCCTGLLFRHVRISDDEVDLVARLNIPVRDSRSSGRVMPLTCSFLDGTACTVYADRPGKCRSFACILRRRVSNGTVGAPQARGVIDDLKILIHLMDPMLQELSGESFRKLNFRDFCRRFARDAEARIADGRGLSETAQSFIPVAFEVIKIIDREFRETSRLAAFERLLMASDRWDGGP